ncbi:MAG TPA: hypothetical protein VIL13_12475 [Longimicrobiales bacterium]
MKGKALFLIPALALLPGALQAQNAEARSEVVTAAQAQTPEARIENALNVAVSAGIPVSLLQRKVEEGRAKGVPMERIAAAVEARLQALMQAKEAIRRAEVGTVTEGELSVAADAIQAGLDQSTVAKVARSAPREQRAVAIAVMTDLVRLGHMPEPAYRRVSEALSRGPEALANLRAETAASLSRRGNAANVGVRGRAAVGVR